MRLSPWLPTLEERAIVYLLWTQLRKWHSPRLLEQRRQLLLPVLRRRGRNILEELLRVRPRLTDEIRIGANDIPDTGILDGSNGRDLTFESLRAR